LTCMQHCIEGGPGVDYSRTPLPTPVRRLRHLTKYGLGQEPRPRKAPLTLTEQSDQFVPAYRSTWAGFRVREGLQEIWNIPTLQFHPIRPMDTYKWWDTPLPRQKLHQLRPLPQPKVLPDRPVWTKPPAALNEHFGPAGQGMPYRTLDASPGLRYPTPQPYRDPYVAPYQTYMGQGGGGGPS